MKRENEGGGEEELMRVKGGEVTRSAKRGKRINKRT